jgi:hypothetical protein
MNTKSSLGQNKATRPPGASQSKPDEQVKAEPEPLLVKHQKVQRALDVGSSYYWGTLVKSGKIEVVGSGKESRAVWDSVKRHYAELRAQSAGPGRDSINGGKERPRTVRTFASSEP